ncbi:MAG: twin-arginine translocase subunit TatC [Paracoccaceae bacterium]|jgi:sec-independent protein translocase protein TatC
MSDSETEIEESTAPLIEHLTELRTRIIRSVIAFLVGMVICFPFAEQILSFLAEPMADIMRARGEEPQLFFDAPQDAFFAYVKIAVLFGFALTSPYIGMQMWRFVAPGLYKTERGAFLPFLIASPVLFIAGGAFAYYVVMPLAMNFFLGFGNVIPMLSSMLGLGGEAAPDTEIVENGLKVFYFGSIKEYLALAIKFIVAFGICFQLPVLLTLMGKAGLVSAAGLKSVRKYAMVAILVLAAIVTPPDVITQGILFVVVYGLYEVSIVLVKIVEKKREERLRAEGYYDDEDEAEEAAKKSESSDDDAEEVDPLLVEFDEDDD